VQRLSKYYLTIPALLASAWLIQAQFAGSKVNKWTATADMSAARSAACSVRLADGRVLVAGGAGEAGALNSVELYSADGTFSTAAPMLQPRANAACAMTQDGRVLVAGGSNLQSAEVYDPSEDTWTSVGNMNVARTGGFAVPPRAARSCWWAVSRPARSNSS